MIHSLELPDVMIHSPALPDVMIHSQELPDINAIRVAEQVCYLAGASSENLELANRSWLKIVDIAQKIKVIP